MLVPACAVQYGPYTHAPGSCNVTISRNALYNAGGHGIPYGYEEVWNIKGKVFGNGPAEVDAKLGQLISAYMVNGYDLILLREDGITASQHALFNNDCHGGTQIMRLPSFPTGGSGQYVQYRDFEIEVRGQIPTPDGPTYLTYKEKLTFVGGGPKWGFVECAVGDPVRQTFRQATIFKITQEGSAVGYLAAPPVPEPIWPAYFKNDISPISQETPERFGSDYQGFPVSWAFQFESDVPLIGQPTLLY